MLEITLDAIIEAWKARKRKQNTPELIVLRHAILQSLANSQPVSVEQAAVDSGLPLAMARELFHTCCSLGADVDSDGNITGMALSLHPTPHLFRIQTRELYAWCALDTLFLPGLIGQTAHVESVCPATGTRIQLRVTPAGVREITPADTVLSVVVPEVSAACQPGQPGGAQGPTCSSMHFFRSQEAAAQWLVTSPDVAILTVKEAWQLAAAAWIEPYAEIIATR